MHKAHLQSILAEKQHHHNELEALREEVGRHAELLLEALHPCQT